MHEPTSHLAEDLARLAPRTSRRESLRGGLALGAGLLLFPRLLRAEDAACAPIPRETAGPFPANATIGPNLLDDAGVVRKDLRKSFGGAAGAAPGADLSLRLALTDRRCAPLAGRAVYVWHCDAVGRYSLYSRGAERENYLRGVQVSDAEGRVAFDTVLPGCYPGRWPHVHFEVYESAEAAARGARPITTSQLAFTKAVCDEAYANESYGPSARHLSRLSLERDGIFHDGAARQTAETTGSFARGYLATLSVTP
jgi:protocatechuate 3,4-dioxygenase beta subunit